MNLNAFNVTDPTTFTITFDGNAKTKLFEVFDSEQELYYFRHLDGKTGTININFPQAGYYQSGPETPFTIIASKPLLPGGQNIVLPKPDRNFPINNLKVELNPNLKDTPARIFPKIGVIELAPKTDLYPPPLKLFILLHEQAHCLYSDEFACDLYALKQYLFLGYNASMAYYALSHVLKVSPQNIERLKVMFKNVMNFSGK